MKNLVSAPKKHLDYLGRKIAIHYLLTLKPKAFQNFLAGLPRIDGPALVVGSAPNPTPPQAVDSSWFKISINASQFVLDKFDLGHPDLTLFQPKIKFEDETREAYWKVLAGKKTGHLIFSINSRNDGQIEAFLTSKGYRTGKISYSNEHHKNAVVRDVLGTSVIGTSRSDRSISNGVYAAILALKLGADKVVMSGFSMERGWSHSDDVKQGRKHQVMDTWACKLMVEQGLPVYTSEQNFSKLTGTPLWKPLSHGVRRMG